MTVEAIHEAIHKQQGYGCRWEESDNSWCPLMNDSVLFIAISKEVETSLAKKLEELK